MWLFETNKDNKVLILKAQRGRNPLTPFSTSPLSCETITSIQKMTLTRQSRSRKETSTPIPFGRRKCVRTAFQIINFVSTQQSGIYLFIYFVKGVWKLKFTNSYHGWHIHWPTEKVCVWDPSMFTRDAATEVSLKPTGIHPAARVKRAGVGSRGSVCHFIATIS